VCVCVCFLSFLQVYQLSIQAACGLLWPADRIVIQVLDDSTDPFIKVILYCTRLLLTQGLIILVKPVASGFTLHYT
jgi:hypothetical protein